MALKLLQITGAAAVVITMLFLIPVLIKLRDTFDQIGGIVDESSPQTISLLQKAQGAVDGLNRELGNVVEITDDTLAIISKLDTAATEVERAVKSPMAKTGFVAVGAVTTSLAVRKRFSDR